MPDLVSFSLTPTMRGGAVLRRGVRRTRRAFLDFVIDGRPPLSLLDAADLVSVLATDLPAAALKEEVDRFVAPRSVAASW